MPRKKIYLQLGCFPDMQVGELGWLVEVYVHCTCRQELIVNMVIKFIQVDERDCSVTFQAME